MARSSWVVVALGLLLAAQPAFAQKAEITSGPVKLSFSGRMQFQFNSTSVAEDEVGTATPPAATTFETRRVRMAVELTIADWIHGLIEPDIAMGRLQIRQAWMDLGFSDALALKAGQWKKPFSLIQLTSSTKTPMIERAVRIRGLTDAVKAASPAGTLTSFRGTPLLGEEQYLLEVLGYDSYDLGAAVHGTVGKLGYEVGMFNGTGSDKADENDGKSFAARATYVLPVKQPLTVGAGVSRRDYTYTEQGVTITDNGTALQADVEWGAYRRPGMWLQAEYAQGDNLVNGDFQAAQAVATWYVPTASKRVEGVEPIFRLSWGDPNTDVADDAGTLLTPGINLHFYSRNKLMLNWDWYLPQGDAFAKQNAFRAQVQLYY